nr:hypothetical protein BgiMline_025632 [Biomphalaria glabrata]
MGFGSPMVTTPKLDTENTAASDRSQFLIDDETMTLSSTNPSVRFGNATCQPEDEMVLKQCLEIISNEQRNSID